MARKSLPLLILSFMYGCLSEKPISDAHAYEPPARITEIHKTISDPPVESPVSPSSLEDFSPLVIVASKSEKENTLEKKVEGVEIISVNVVSGSDAQADSKPKYAKEGETVWLYAVVKAKTPQGIVYFTQTDNVTIDGKKIPTKQLKSWNYPLDLLLEWYKIEADSNGKWYVRDKGARCPAKSPCRDVDYVEVYTGDGWKMRANAHPTFLKDQFPESETGLGVMRYKVTAIQGGKEISSPGREAMQKSERKVPKVAFRGKTNSPVDFLFELFNTPYIWGSTQDTVDMLVGSDCADLVVYGRRRAGHKQKYTWSGGLSSVTNPVVTLNRSRRHSEHYFDTAGNKILVQNGEKSVFPGDILLWKGHAAVFYKDNGDGYLGEHDLMIQTIFSEPSVDHLYEGMGFAPREIRRWR